MTATTERLRARVLLVGLLLWWSLAFAPAAHAQEHLEVRVLDIGQADAVLLQHDGLRVLYDAGAPLGSDGTAVADRLTELGVDTLHLVVLSHPHFDHLGGMPSLLRSGVVVLRVLDNGAPHDTEIYRETYRLIDSLGVARPTIEPPGVSWYSLPDGDVLWRSARAWILPPAATGGLNDRSVGFRACLGEACIMLAGDAEEAAWERWMEEYPELLEPVTVHRASHHGSRNGDTEEALALLSPELVIVSTGAGNRYGHPHPEALSLYKDAGARVLRTDLHGEIVVEIHRDGSLRTWTERVPTRPYVDPWWQRWPWGTMR